MGAFLDNQEGLPDPLKAALNTPILGQVLREATRPANWMSAAIAPLSFAPKAGALTRFGAEIAAGTAGSIVGQKVTDATGNSFAGLGAGLLAGQATGAGASRALGPAARGVGAGATAYRDITKNIPVGASVKDIGGGLPDNLSGGGAPSFVDALDGLRNAVRTEAKLRNSGVADAEVKAGRGTQFGSVRNSIKQAIEQGLSGEDLANAARRGAAVGGLRRTVAGPVQVTEAQRKALFDEVYTRIANPNEDAGKYLTTVEALQKALDGQGLMRHEIRALQPLLGNDMATALAGRAATNAPAGSATGSIPGARGGGPKLGGKAGLPTTETKVPLGGRGKPAQPERMGGITKGNIALEESARARILREQEALLGRTAPDFLGETQSVRRPEFPSAPSGVSVTGNPRKASDLLVDPLAEQHRVSAVREGLKMAEKETLRQVGPSEDVLLERAQALLRGEGGPSSEVALDLPGAPTVRKVSQEVEQAIDIWLQGNRELLDNMGPEGSQIIANFNAQLTGNVADSYLSAALSRRNILAEALRATWGEVPDEAAAIQRDKIIGRVAEALFQRELKIRYPEGVPDRITELMKTTRSLPYDESLGAVSTFSQRAKNSMFGVLDIGVFGVQGLNAIRRGGVPLFAAMINRSLAAMHMPHVATMYADTMLSRQVQYGLDGVKQGAVTGAFAKTQGRQEVGSMFSYLGPIGRAVDRPYIAVADRLSQWQFGTVLGGLRNAAYEGDLVMARMLGQDISKASVRRAAAANANAIGSFAESALRKSRAQKEGVAFLSAPMTRARVNQITQMANLIKPTANSTERILAATTIISTVGYTLAVGKLLNDYIGIGDFEFMPDKPGFGQITTATGRVIDVIPQDSVERAFAKSIAAILNEDPTEAAKAWGNVALGSAGPFPRTGAAAFNVGYEPGRGYRYGDMGGDLKDRLLNLAPIPPMANSAIRGKVDALGSPLEALGITNFQESAYAKASRIFEQETGGNWKDAVPAEKAPFLEKHPDLAAELEQAQVDRGGPEGALAQKRIDSRSEQEADDTRVLSKEIDWDQWKDNRNRRLSEVRGFSESVYGSERIAEPKNAYEEWLNVVRDNETPDGINWDQVDVWVAQQDAPRQKFIEDNTGLYGTPLEKERRAVADKLDKEGYFDIRDKVWAGMSKNGSQFGKTASDFELSIRQKVEATVRKNGGTEQQAAIIASRVIKDNGILNRWSEVANDIEQGWIIKNRQLAATAFRLGFMQKSLRVPEEAAIMAGSR